MGKFPQLEANIISINLNTSITIIIIFLFFYSRYSFLAPAGNITRTITYYDVSSANWMKVSGLSVF